MANGDCKEIFATFVGVEKTACVQAAAALAWPSDIFIFLPLLEPKLPFCERSNTIKRRALRQPLARGYLDPETNHFYGNAMFTRMVEVYYLPF